MKYIIVVQSDVRGWARILWDRIDFTDLADFHNDYGLRILFVKRVDGEPLSMRNHRALMQQVESDIHYDFGRM